MYQWPFNLFNFLRRSYLIYISVIVLYLCIEKLLPSLLSLSLSSAVFNPRKNKLQLNQSPTCCRDFKRVNGNKQQRELVIECNSKSHCQGHYCVDIKNFFYKPNVWFIKATSDGSFPNVIYRGVKKRQWLFCRQLHFTHGSNFAIKHL